MKESLVCSLALAILILFPFAPCLHAEQVQLEVVMSLIRVESQNRRLSEFGEKEGISKAFEDDKIKIAWSLSERLDGMMFVLGNKTDQTIRIPWDSASFVDELGVNHRVIHSGVRYAEVDRPQPPSVVLARSVHTDVVIPADYIYWNRGLHGSWETKLLLRTLQGQMFSDGYLPSYGETGREISDKLKSYEGKIFRVLLPLIMADKLNEYIFTFRINRAVLLGKSFESQVSRKEWLVLSSFLWIKPGRTTRQELIARYGKPSSEDDDSLLYKASQHSDFSRYQALKFLTDERGTIRQIRAQE